VAERSAKVRLLPARVHSATWLSCFSTQDRGRGSAKSYVFHHAEGSRWPADFELHSLRHTFGTRLWEFGADAFTIMRLMGHSTVTVSQRYVHPSPEALELAYECMMAMNLRRLPTTSPHCDRGRRSSSFVSCLF
jgi:site-specific recombinase XerD